jgi:hypothetical protein
MSKVEFRITRTGDNMADYTVSFTEEQMGIIYDALNDFGYEDNEDDNLPSQIMNKLYNLLEF